MFHFQPSLADFKQLRQAEETAHNAAVQTIDPTVPRRSGPKVENRRVIDIASGEVGAGALLQKGQERITLRTFLG